MNAEEARAEAERRYRGDGIEPPLLSDPIHQTLAVEAFELGAEWQASRKETERERDLERTIADLGEEVRIAREGQDAAIEVMNQHRCGEQAESAYRRAMRAESREVTEAKVEAVAESIFEVLKPGHLGGWDVLKDSGLASGYRGAARAALEAFLEVRS